MSNDVATGPKETAHDWLKIAETWGLKVIGFLTWLVGVVTWLVWVTGDRTDPAPPSPTPPPLFVTLDVLPQTDGTPGPFLGVTQIDLDLSAGTVAEFRERVGRDDLIVTLKDGTRLGRGRQILFGDGSAITLDGKPVNKAVLLDALAKHKVKAVFHGDRFGPIRNADFTTITE